MVAKVYLRQKKPLIPVRGSCPPQSKTPIQVVEGRGYPQEREDDDKNNRKTLSLFKTNLEYSTLQKK